MLLARSNQVLVLGLDIFQMLRPGKLDKHRHSDGRKNGIGRLVRKADGHESQDQVGLLPIPEILVEEVNNEHKQSQEQLCQGLHEDISETMGNKPE